MDGRMDEWIGRGVKEREREGKEGEGREEEENQLKQATKIKQNLEMINENNVSKRRNQRYLKEVAFDFRIMNTCGLFIQAEEIQLFVYAFSTNVLYHNLNI